MKVLRTGVHRPEGLNDSIWFFKETFGTFCEGELPRQGSIKEATLIIEYDGSGKFMLLSLPGNYWTKIPVRWRYK